MSHHGHKAVTVTSQQQSCHGIAAQLSRSRHDRKTVVTVTAYPQSCHSHRMPAKLSRSHHAYKAVTAAWPHRCHGHGMATQLTLSLCFLKFLRYHILSYKEDGHCKGEPLFEKLPAPARLQWDIPTKVSYNYTIRCRHTLLVKCSLGTKS
jgi:hypothetical protein